MHTVQDLKCLQLVRENSYIKIIVKWCLGLGSLGNNTLRQGLLGSTLIRPYGEMVRRELGSGRRELLLYSSPGSISQLFHFKARGPLYPILFID